MINVERYQSILKEVEAAGASLVAVSKFKPVEDIKALYDLGHRDFGENYVQELVSKQAVLPSDIRWHFIGHLQRNKVKYIAPFIHLIHSVDSFKLLKEINKQAEKNDRNISCLLQMHVTDEATKTGMTDTDLNEFVSFYEVQKKALFHVSLKGIMGMTTLTEEEALVRQDLKSLKTIFEFAKKSYFLFQDSFSILSMGMSGDYQMALEEGSNMVRIGSLIFGRRNNPS